MDVDRPITGAEESPDLLNREGFAQDISKILLREPSDECMTVSLEGEWGYGKTSLINLVKRSLSTQETKPIVVEYNPWLAGKAESLIQDFLIQFASQLNLVDNSREGLRIARELVTYSELFNVMKFVPGAEPWASTIKGLFNAVGTASDKISKLKELDQIGKKNQIRDYLSKLSIPIVVIIDDIDRLTPEESYQIIRLVKAVADFPGTCFLLAFDPLYLATSLQKFGITNSNQYIDKIVQLRVSLPIIAHRDLQKVVDIELKRLSDKPLTDYYKNDQERFAYIYNKHCKYLVKTPREIKKVFNHLKLVLLRVQGQVCFTDLYCLSVIAIKAPEVYLSIKNSPKYYVGRAFSEGVELDDEGTHEEQRQVVLTELLKSYSKHERHHIEGILEEMFPTRLDHGYSYFIFGSDFDDDGRVAVMERLYIALHYQTPSGLTSDKEVISFIEGRHDRDVFLQKIIADNLVDRFFELYEIYIPRYSRKESEESLKSLYAKFLNSTYMKQHQVGFYEEDLFKRICRLTGDHFQKKNDNDEFPFYLISDPKYLPITSYITSCLLVQTGDINSGDSGLETKTWLDPEVIDDYIKKWVLSVESNFLDNDLYESFHAPSIYYTLCKADKNTVVKIFRQWLEEAEGLKKIACLIGKAGRDTAGGAYAQVSREKLKDLIDYDKLLATAERALNEGEEELPNFYKAVYKSILTEELYYHCDASLGSKL